MAIGWQWKVEHSRSGPLGCSVGRHSWMVEVLGSARVAQLRHSTGCRLSWKVGRFVVLLQHRWSAVQFVGSHGRLSACLVLH